MLSSRWVFFDNKLQRERIKRIYFQLSFFVFSYALPLLLIVAMYSLMLYTLLCKVLPTKPKPRRIRRREKPFLAIELAIGRLCILM